MLSLLQHSSDDEIISGSDKMGERSTTLALVPTLPQGRQEEDWTRSAAPSSKEGSELRVDCG